MQLIWYIENNVVKFNVCLYRQNLLNEFHSELEVSGWSVHLDVLLTRNRLSLYLEHVQNE